MAIVDWTMTNLSEVSWTGTKTWLCQLFPFDKFWHSDFSGVKSIKLFVTYLIYQLSLCRFFSLWPLRFTVYRRIVRKTFYFQSYCNKCYLSATIRQNHNFLNNWWNLKRILPQNWRAAYWCWSSVWIKFNYLKKSSNDLKIIGNWNVTKTYNFSWNKEEQTIFESAVLNFGQGRELIFAKYGHVVYCSI